MTASPLSRQLSLTWGAVALAAAALLPWLGPRALALPACPLRVATGWPCPACGSGRAVASLAHGDLVGALGWNPLAVVAAVAFGVAGVVAAFAELARRPLTEPRTLPAWARAALPLALAANWLYLTWALG